MAWHIRTRTSDQSVHPLQTWRGERSSRWHDYLTWSWFKLFPLESRSISFTFNIRFLSSSTFPYLMRSTSNGWMFCQAEHNVREGSRDKRRIFEWQRGMRKLPLLKLLTRVNFNKPLFNFDEIPFLHAHLKNFRLNERQSSDYSTSKKKKNVVLTQYHWMTISPSVCLINLLLPLEQTSCHLISAYIWLLLSIPSITMHTVSIDIDIDTWLSWPDGYSASEIVYRWKGDQVGDRIGVGIELPSFDLVSVSDFESQIMLTTGNYSRIGVRFVIDRKLAGYIWRIYLPAILMVVSSFVPFYLKKSSSVHRIFISSLSFVSLIFITLLTAVSFTPKSGSLTTLDIFLFVSSSFSFICMILISLITTCHVSSSSKTRDSIGRAEQNNLNNAIADDKNEDGSEDDSYTEKGKTLDQIGKFIMPLLFLVFNAFYWLVSVIFPAAILGWRSNQSQIPLDRKLWHHNEILPLSRLPSEVDVFPEINPIKVFEVTPFHVGSMQL